MPTRLRSFTRALFTASLLLGAASAAAAPKSVTLKGKLPGGSGYTVLFVGGKGRVARSVVGGNGSFSFKAVTTKELNGATLALLDPTGRAYGPLVLSSSKKTMKAYSAFSGQLPQGRTPTLDLGKALLKEGYALLAKPLKATLVGKKLVSNLASDGSPAGAKSAGLAPTAPGLRVMKDDFGHDGGSSSPGRLAQDSDFDGVIDALDPDLDGDGIPNIADPDFRGNENATFSSLFLGFQETLNANLGGLTREKIDQTLASDHRFIIGFWFSLPRSSTITGGHVVCAPTNPYCARGTGTAVYNGVMESNPAYRQARWVDMDMNRSGYPNLEPLAMHGGLSLSASVEPRVGTASVQAGDAFQIEFTDVSGSIVGSKLLVLSPYPVTVPAIKSFTVEGVEEPVDYHAATTTAGSNESTPVKLGASGLLGIKAWRPQRGVYRGESGEFRDFGHLRYGVSVEGAGTPFSCAGFYSNLSSTLTERPNSLGEGGSPDPAKGAELRPLLDRASDAVPSPDSTISFTVDLKSCLARAGLGAGRYRMVLVAAGEQLSNGTNSAAQMFHVEVQ